MKFDDKIIAENTTKRQVQLSLFPKSISGGPDCHGSYVGPPHDGLWRLTRSLFGVAWPLGSRRPVLDGQTLHRLSRQPYLCQLDHEFEDHVGWHGRRR